MPLNRSHARTRTHTHRFCWEELRAAHLLRRTGRSFARWRGYAENRIVRRGGKQLAHLHARRSCLASAFEHWEDYLEQRRCKRAVNRFPN